jgi:hypothetical protein
MGRTGAHAWPAAALVLAALPFLPDDTSGSSPPPPPTREDGCHQTAYAVHDAGWQEPFTWVMNLSSVPAYLDPEETLGALEDATATLTHAHSPCPLARGVVPAVPPAIYAGPTERRANVTHDGMCFPESNTDGINVVSFGPLPDDVVAVTCSYVDGHDIWQSDVLLNDAPGIFTLDPAEGCVDGYDLQAVMTHERGHSFGLAHVPERPGTDALTMSTAMDRCDTTARTLAAGDVLGLALLY